MPPSRVPGFRGITLAYNVRLQEDVDAIVARKTACGGTVIKPPEEKVWGGYGGDVADPDGLAWEIARGTRISRSARMARSGFRIEA